MEKKKYYNPTIQIINIDESEIICQSTDVDVTYGGGGNDE